MTIPSSKPANMFLAIQVLHFISQLRRRVKPRVQGGSADPSAPRITVSGQPAAVRCISLLPTDGVHGTKQALHTVTRISKSRSPRSKRDQRKAARPRFNPQALRAGAPATSNRPGDEVQQMLDSAHVRFSPPGSTLSEIAGSDKLFLKHEKSPAFEGCSLKDLMCLVAVVQRAVTMLSDCRMEYGDRRLVALGQYHGLELDEKFIANLEHLLLRLQAELVAELLQRALGERQQGGHDKKQQKMLSWFTEFADKPGLLGLSFPWTIKPSLAVLWGVCWMFYDKPRANANAKANAEQQRGVYSQQLLHCVDVPWAARRAAPGPFEYDDYRRALIGPSTAAASEVSGPKTAARSLNAGEYDAHVDAHVLLAGRNADDWISDLQPVGEGTRLLDSAGAYARVIGSSAWNATSAGTAVLPSHLAAPTGPAPPQHAHLFLSTGQNNTYCPPHHHHGYSDQDCLFRIENSEDVDADISSLSPFFAQLSQPWHPLPLSSPQLSPRHHVAQQITPTIRVDAADSHPPGPPQPQPNDWLYLDPTLSLSGQPHPTNPVNPVSALTSIFHLTMNPVSPRNMECGPLPPVSQISQMPLQLAPQMTPQLPSQAPSQVPSQITIPPTKHERSTSITNLPTPSSMAGNRSPSPSTHHRHILSSPRSPHSLRRVSESSESSQEGDDHLGSLRKNHTYKRSGEPPRNHESKMVCEHRECAGLTFDRKCEWSKHMDKHDRPYKCLVSGCEKLQGFTYSGGLLRHEREVHKLHGGTKKSLFCPFNDCKRSSGAGFTRKENLAEHVRRVHRRTSMSADLNGLIIRRESLIERSPTAESRAPSSSPYTRVMEYREGSEPAHKRKFSIISDRSEDRGEDDLRAEIKRLRYQNDEKDSRLLQLEHAVKTLQQSLQQTRP